MKMAMINRFRKYLNGRRQDGRRKTRRKASGGMMYWQQDRCGNDLGGR